MASSLRFPCILFALAMVGWSSLLASVLSASNFMGVPRERIEEAMEATYDLDPASDALIARLTQDFPDSPLGLFIKASKAFWMDEYDGGFNESAYETLNEVSREALELAKRYEKNNPKSIDACWLVAMIELNQARFQIERGHSLSAFFKSRSGLRGIRKVLKDEPDYFDAMLPLGLANCYLDQVPVYLRPFAVLMRFTGDMEAGLEMLESAKANGFLTGYEARYYLAEIRREILQQNDAAMDEIAFLVDRFPGNVAYRRLLAKGYAERGDYQKAFEEYERTIRTPVLDSFRGLRTRTLLEGGQIAYQLDRFYDALVLAKQSQEAADSIPELRRTRGWAVMLEGSCLYRLGRGSEAVAVLEGVERRENPQAYQEAKDLIELIRSG